MYTAKRIPFRVIWPFAWKSVLTFLAFSTVLCCLYVFAGWTFIAIPFTPIATIGTAVAFYVGLKNNSAYGRLWEGRQIWGRIVNSSRTWGILVNDYVISQEPGDPEAETALYDVKKQLIYRHLAYLNALRIQLRRQTVWQQHEVSNQLINRIDSFKQNTLDEELKRYLPADEVEKAVTYTNSATQILRQQSKLLRLLRNNGQLSDLYHIELEKMLGDFYDCQGACERIKTFPFPRQYAFFSYLFVWIFIAVLPFGLLNELSKMGLAHVWLTIPFYTVIAWVFYTMEVVGDTSENPFENGINDVPMSAICRTIEIDLREMLGENDVPKRLTAVENILM